jgi:redox-sensitive bicupin YhaK (pirin superfamily)
MTVRVVSGEIDAKDTTTRTVIPTANQPRWPPFERVAETIAAPRRHLPPHRHQGVEVLTYVIEGSGTYEFGPDPPAQVRPGSIKLLTAPSSASHRINPGVGQTVRWFAMVVALPDGLTSAPELQSGVAKETGMRSDGTAVRVLVGPKAEVRSAAGAEAEAIRFVNEGTSFRRVGHDSMAVCYALMGRGMVDSVPIEGGEAALVDDAAGIAVQGTPGFQAVFVRVPRGPSTMPS